MQELLNTAILRHSKQVEELMMTKVEIMRIEYNMTQPWFSRKSLKSYLKFSPAARKLTKRSA